ncbi:MAG: hypothetical protein JXA04_00635 [Gammaproteobacteria bacterium]|nr:hypothetical protein [Gammaproteobacteria bacterium]
MDNEDYEKLRHPENFSLTALVKLSKLRRKVAEHGYEFFNLKEGEIILLLEAARLISCEETRDLAQQFMNLIGVKDKSFASQSPQSTEQNALNLA